VTAPADRLRAALDRAATRRTNDDPEVRRCTDGGVGHDWRPFDYVQYPSHVRTSWRCVWCFALACGDYGQPDPCWEPHFHEGPHRSRSGVTWPIGGNRA
jgi:hypothetical protein